ncbi:hypothetical protein HanIR_Chr14g0671571 [Helianthus annuus]|nr:hypothetical protein HanIR_Chr14g0671571 [Helianthus annuus]
MEVAVKLFGCPCVPVVPAKSSAAQLPGPPTRPQQRGLSRSVEATKSIINLVMINESIFQVCANLCSWVEFNLWSASFLLLSTH